MRRHLLSILLAGTACTVAAAPLTPEEALARLQDSPSRKMPMASVPALAYTGTDSEGAPAYYIFSNAARRGFTVVSADSDIVPVLGYTDSGVFDGNSLPPAFEYWLQSYAAQIEYLRANGLDAGEPKAPSHPDWEPVSPLVATAWDQGSPYNDQCPEKSGRRTYTGCVATAMSQVMNYFKYPEIGTGVISYKPTSLGRTLRLDLSKQAFDWDHMLNHYVYGMYTEEEGNAVAYLMKAAGYSVNMNYNTSASGALSTRIPGALSTYFGYSENAYCADRDIYSYDEWSRMIYENLANYGPVIYNGRSSDGGHSFICDGYDGDGYFHINWGWGGMSDGFYLLDALAPSAQGIGGSSSAFNYDQDATLCIYPDNGEPVTPRPYYLTQFGSIEAKAVGGKVYFNLLGDESMLGWANMQYERYLFDMGFIIENLEDADEAPRYVTTPELENISLGSGYILAYPAVTPSLSLSSPDVTMAEGVPYRFTLASRWRDEENAEWIPVVPSYGDSNCAVITKSADGIKIDNFSPAAFAVYDMQLNSDLYYDCPAKLSARIENDSELQISRTIAPVLLDENGNICFTGDTFLLTLAPGEVLNYDWIATWTQVAGNAVSAPTEFVMKMWDMPNNRYLEGANELAVTMEANPGTPTVMGSVSLPGVPTVEGSKIYKVSDSRHIPVNVTVRIGRGYFAYPVRLHILQVDPDDPGYLISIFSQAFTEVPFLNGGESAELSTEVDFTNPEPDQTYTLQCSYRTATKNVWMNSSARFIYESAGVDNVSSDRISLLYDKTMRQLTVFGAADIADIQAVFTDGRKAIADIQTQDDNMIVDFSGNTPGILIVTVSDKDGGRRTLKVVL